jgi:hypothetical protein
MGPSQVPNQKGCEGGARLDGTVSTGQDQHGKMYQIPVLGGTPRLLVDKADTGVSFSPDGTQLTYVLLDIHSGKVGVMIAKAMAAARENWLNTPLGHAW